MSKLFSSSNGSSDSSENSLLEQTRTQLIQENQKIKKEIQKAKALKERYENDIQVAQEAYNLGEMAFIRRIKKLSALFGGTLKNDEDLIDKIQGLMDSIAEDEKTAKVLRGKLEEHKFAKTQNDTMIKGAQTELEKQKIILSEKKDELAEYQRQHDIIEAELASMRKKKDDYMKSIQPISDAIGVGLHDPSFFSTLKTRLTSIDKSLEYPLRDLANVAGIRFDGIENFDPKSFFDDVGHIYTRLRVRRDEERRLEGEVISRLDALSAEVNEKRKRAKSLKESIAALEQEIAIRKRSQEQQHNAEKIELSQKVEKMRAKEMRHYRRVIEAIGAKRLLKSDTTLEDAVEIQTNTIVRIAKKTAEMKANAAELDSKDLERFKRGVHTIENVADCIINANRKLMRKYC